MQQQYNKLTSSDSLNGVQFDRINDFSEIVEKLPDNKYRLKLPLKDFAYLIDQNRSEFKDGLGDSNTTISNYINKYVSQQSNSKPFKKVSLKKTLDRLDNGDIQIADQRQRQLQGLNNIFQNFIKGLSR
jgi:hypothetical protein